MERKRAEVNLMADLMATVKDPATATQEEPVTQALPSRRSSAADRQKVSAGSPPATGARSNVGVIDQDSPDRAEEMTSAPAEKSYKPRRHLISVMAIAASLLSILWVTHQGKTARHEGSTPSDSPGFAVRPYERIPISNHVLEFSATQRPGPAGAYAAALQIQNAEYQGASRVWCVLADPRSRDCARTMSQSFRTHEDSRRTVFLVTTSVGKMNPDRTSAEIMLRLGEAERQVFPLEWIDGRWQADPVIIPAAKENGGIYTTVVAHARFSLCVAADC
ncbi:hypothetical protein [Streptomyces geranii]|uniref:hypothetical protein n=1 Tax=Streptomyces geranii TaxID=2058923 RepID=UPI001300840C|nr:hypothetical protein [Streptomyces geranii]